MRYLIVTMSLIFALGCAPEDEESPELAETPVEEAETIAPGEPEEPTEVADMSPCDWITEAEASEALGHPVQYRSTVDDGSSNCIVDGVGNEALSVDFTVWSDDPYAFQGTADGENSERIDGLGDRAAWDPTMSTIAVEKGNRTFTAYFSGIDESAKEKASAFAAKVVEKM